MYLNHICNEILHTAEASDFKQIASLLSHFKSHLLLFYSSSKITKATFYKPGFIEIMCPSTS